MRSKGKGSSEAGTEGTASSFVGERLAKVMARAGVCSRRDAERLISAGRVAVDGTVVLSPALNVTDDNVITIDGKPLSVAEETRVWRFHKPTGTITAARDPRGRPTVFDVLPPGMPRVVTVGRLDYNTEGLLLLTNDGALAHFLELPRNAWARRYRVHVRGYLDTGMLAVISKGVTIKDVRYGPVEVEVVESKDTDHWLLVTIHEGKNREVRNIMTHLGLEVRRLIRVEYGPFKLGKLPYGKVEEVPKRVLLKSLDRFFSERGREDRGKPSCSDASKKSGDQGSH